jgi:hypothetical protein
LRLRLTGRAAGGKTVRLKRLVPISPCFRLTLSVS